MAYELVYTSVPRGIKPGTSGFCIAAYTANLPAALASQLEGLSAYKTFYPHYDANAALNPVSWFHYVYSNSNDTFHFLSRVSFYGLDYTNRSNKLAHHLVLKQKEISAVPDGPGSLLMNESLFRSEWHDEPQVFQTPPVICGANTPFHKSQIWEQYTGDAGWAGELAAYTLANPKKNAYIIYDPQKHTDIRGLITEALLLIPQKKRWEITFNSYYTSLPAGLQCQWRFCTIGSDAPKDAKRIQGTLIIDLTGPCPHAGDGELQQAARTGIPVPVKKEVVQSPKISEEGQRSPVPDLPTREPQKTASPKRISGFSRTMPVACPPPQQDSWQMQAKYPMQNPGQAAYDMDSYYQMQPKKSPLKLIFVLLTVVILAAGGAIFFAVHSTSSSAMDDYEYSSSGKTAEGKGSGTTLSQVPGIPKTHTTASVPPEKKSAPGETAVKPNVPKTVELILPKTDLLKKQYAFTVPVQKLDFQLILSAERLMRQFELAEKMLGELKEPASPEQKKKLDACRNTVEEARIKNDAAKKFVEESRELFNKQTEDGKKIVWKDLLKKQKSFSVKELQEISFLKPYADGYSQYLKAEEAQQKALAEKKRKDEEARQKANAAASEIRKKADAEQARRKLWTTVGTSLTTEEIKEKTVPFNGLLPKGVKIKGVTFGRGSGAVWKEGQEEVKLVSNEVKTMKGDELSGVETTSHYIFDRLDGNFKLTIKHKMRSMDIDDMVDLYSIALTSGEKLYLRFRSGYSMLSDVGGNIQISSDDEKVSKVLMERRDQISEKIAKLCSNTTSTIGMNAYKDFLQWEFVSAKDRKPAVIWFPYQVKNNPDRNYKPQYIKGTELCRINDAIIQRSAEIALHDKLLEFKKGIKKYWAAEDRDKICESFAKKKHVKQEDLQSILGGIEDKDGVIHFESVKFDSKSSIPSLKRFIELKFFKVLDMNVWKKVSGKEGLSGIKVSADRAKLVRQRDSLEKKKVQLLASCRARLVLVRVGRNGNAINIATPIYWDKNNSWLLCEISVTDK